MDETHSESKMWKRSTVVLAVVLLLASGMFLFLEAARTPQKSGRVVVPLDQNQGNLVTELENVVEERDRLQADRTRLSEAKANLGTELATVQAEVAEFKAGLEQNADDLAERDARIETLSLERINLMTRVTDLIAARLAVENRLEEVQQEKNQLVTLLEKTRGERDTIEAALSQAETQRESLAEKVEALRGKVARFSLEAGELEDLAKIEPEVAQSEGPQREDVQVVAEESLSLPPQKPEQASVGGDFPARRREMPQEKEALFAGVQDAPSLGEGVAVAADGPSALVSGVLERGVAQYNQGQYKRAFDVWYPLAEQGVRRAQFYIGSLFHEGRGVEQDQIKAFYWLSLSDKAGYPNAGTVLQTVEQIMTEAQMAAAHKLLDTAEN